MNNNHIKNLEPLRPLKYLYHLSFRNNHVEDISPLSDLSKLGNISMANNKIRYLSPLLELDGLYNITAYGNPMADCKGDVVKIASHAIQCENGWISPNTNNPADTTPISRQSGKFD